MRVPSSKLSAPTRGLEIAWNLYYFFMVKAALVRKEKILETLSAQAIVGKRLLEPLKSFAALNKLPLNILEDKKIRNDAEAHKFEGDLWYCLEGEIIFIHGGELIDPVFGKNADGSINENELTAKEIRGGDEIVIKQGDWFWIPPGVPHQHSASGIARLIIIKIPSHPPASLDA